MQRSRRRLWACSALCLVTLLACAALQWEPLGPRRTALVEGAEALGSEDCLACHEEVQGHEKIASYHSGCESCHGLGSLHGDSEEVADIRFPSNADCLACHAVGRDTHLQWGTGEHSRADLLCSDCHNPHDTGRRHLRTARVSAFPHMDDTSRLCVECHADVAAQLTFPSHHPVGEGALACTSCHDPHEDSRVRFGDDNQVCAGCHQDYAGPWIFEHAPVVEDCKLCHNPHGAPTQNLLETTQPVICLSCHSLNDLWHHNTAGTGIAGNVPLQQDLPSASSLPPGQRITETEAWAFLRECTSCHNAIHGSYTDEHLRH